MGFCPTKCLTPPALSAAAYITHYSRCPRPAGRLFGFMDAALTCGFGLTSLRTTDGLSFDAAPRAYGLLSSPGWPWTHLTHHLGTPLLKGCLKDWFA